MPDSSFLNLESLSLFVLTAAELVYFYNFEANFSFFFPEMQQSFKVSQSLVLLLVPDSNYIFLLFFLSYLNLSGNVVSIGLFFSPL